MKIWKQATSVVVLAIFSTGIVHADNNFGVGLKAGTVGIGLEASWQPLPYLELRVGANAYDYSDNGDVAGIEYDQELSLESFYGTANIHFPISPMRVTAGIYSNGNEMLLINDDLDDQNIGGIIYPGAGIGTITSSTSFDSMSPYFGIGFDFTLAGKVGMNLDFGLLWQGDPIVDLNVDGPLANDPGFQNALELERQELEDDMSDFKAWPVLQVGFVYKF
ncbi:MAG: hypothetical protein ACR2QL_12570 [Woeseiaceae bacterium]